MVELRGSGPEKVDNAAPVVTAGGNTFTLGNINDASSVLNEPLKRKIRSLSDSLRESEMKVSELTGLVASLTADAHNSQRDMGDIL
ncbi:hypothetical protein Y032_0134g1873 [Ancylostoma ceylanicum]|uniref:Uncharacterized protein n=1 Tax=Ancylostoma ceylanicum TaxID=53326 RepID=A0A016T682_9BILA|nr:hypothetical protein Y032_0134g1873 [Ancylostoma ceylanicum]